MDEAAVQDAIGQVVRTSYGRLVAYLAARSGDLAGAEDALSEALAAALQCWLADGIPRKPEAWLLHVARNRMIDAIRRVQVRQKYEPSLELPTEPGDLREGDEPFPDERLKLLFVCAHPAIDPAARTPLMLQAVLGLSAERIASAFLVSPAAMDKRLLRSKSKIREAGIPFRVPEPTEWAERASFVLDAIYSAYTAGWDHTGDDGSTHRGLAAEAVTLGRMLVELLPDEPEAHGLLALMLHCDARRPARWRERTRGEPGSDAPEPAGIFVPLDQQDPARWVSPLIEEAESHLRTASGWKRLGRYQLEAAIHSIHAERTVTGATDWREIVRLYEGLVRIAPTVGAQVGRAVALAEAGDTTKALAALDAIATEVAHDYQPWWAARAHLLRRLGAGAEARRAFERAASLTDDPAVRTYLLGEANRPS